MRKIYNKFMLWLSNKMVGDITYSADLTKE